MEFIPAASEGYSAPEHLSAVVPYLEAVDETPQFFAFSAPPRHGKSVLLCHFLARYIARYPNKRVAYCCYSADLAEFMSSEIKIIAKNIGVELDPQAKGKGFWRTTRGSTLLAVGPGGGFTGRGADLVVIDDPYKSRAEAESGIVRENVWNWFTAVAVTRREPGASIVITHTRWNPDDLIGRVSKQHDRPYINLPALDQDGNALWPERFDVPALKETRTILGEYDWASLYMGEPRARGGAVFGDCYIYTDEELEKVKFVKYAIGIDCAYTKKTHADYSVAVVLGFDEGGNAWVLDVRRRQCEAPEFERVLRELRLSYVGAPIFWFTGGTEKAVADFFINRGVPVKAEPAKEDKFVRAQAVAAAWNAGRVLVPASHRPWSDVFIAEVLAFTGLDDPHDDQVDALAAAYIPFSRKRVVRGMLQGPVF